MSSAGQSRRSRPRNEAGIDEVSDVRRVRRTACARRCSSQRRLTVSGRWMHPTVESAAMTTPLRGCRPGRAQRPATSRVRSAVATPFALRLSTALQLRVGGSVGAKTPADRIRRSSGHLARSKEVVT
jgi:hypothetical protein